MDAVHSEIVVYGGGDIVLGAKKSNQWIQYTVDAVCSACSGIVVYGGGDIVFDTKKVKRVDAVDAVHSGCSGIVVYGGGDIIFGAKKSNQWMQWMQYAVDTVE